MSVKYCTGSLANIFLRLSVYGRRTPQVLLYPVGLRLSAASGHWSFCLTAVLRLFRFQRVRDSYGDGFDCQQEKKK